MEAKLKDAAEFVKTVKKEHRKEKLREALRKMTWPERFPLPLDPRLECCGVRVDKCKTMDSKKVPLWLHFLNADPVAGEEIIVIFKCGDDLRQDQLTLQVAPADEPRTAVDETRAVAVDETQPLTKRASGGCGGCGGCGGDC